MCWVRQDIYEVFHFSFYRFAKKFFLNGTEYRTLTKAHGILFQIKITGNAGKFSVVPLMLNVASGCALLSVVSGNVLFYVFTFTHAQMLKCWILSMRKYRNTHVHSGRQLACQLIYILNHKY